MTSSYRLGDIVLQNLNDPVVHKEILDEHSGSIGSDYILLENKTDCIGCVTQIILNHVKKYSTLYPHDIENSTVVHLRLGDAVGGGHFYEKRLRPLDISYYKFIIPQGNVYVIGKCHFGKGDCSTNYDECRYLSNEYLKNIINTLNATHFDGGHADVDLCCAVKAKQFVQGRGYYSKLIVEVRRRLGLPSIETNSHIWN